MTPPAKRADHRILRPAVFFPALLLLVIASVLMTPRTPMETRGALTTYSAGAGGAAGLSDVAKRLGWRVRTLEEPFSPSMPSDAIYAVLVPAYELTTSETHILLDRVRAGASALVIAGGGALRDSLHVDVGEAQAPLARGRDSTPCPSLPVTLRTIQTRVPLIASNVQHIGPPVGDTVHLAVLGGRSRNRGPAIVGLRYGNGRIAVAAEPLMFANDALRVCSWGAGIAAVRALEWLSERDGGQPRRDLVFDEFHHGYGNHASVIRTLKRWAFRTPSGRITVQIALAGIILLLAMGARALAPVPIRTVARRSPLEHVSALANAYEKVHGTRIGTRLLVKGVRRRANRPVGPHTVTEEAFLDNLAQRSPALATDVARVKHAMQSETTPAEFLEVAGIIDRIERSVR